MTQQFKNLKGLTVAALESRMAVKMQRLIEQHGGTPIVAPSMQEVPIENNMATFDFFEKIIKDEIDLLVLLTGIATRTFLDILQSKFSKTEILAALAQTKILVRGPKPATVCNILGIKIDYTAPEPNTWQEILELAQNKIDLKNKKIGILEYGKSRSELIDGLTQCGAKVFPIPLYKWDYPENLKPLHQLIDQIIDGKINLLLFTSAQQVHHLLGQANLRGLELALRRALHQVGIISIGPVCSETLIDAQLFPDLEANPHKMEDLVAQTALHGAEIVNKKQQRTERCWVGAFDSVGAGSPRPQVTGGETRATHALHLRKESPMLQACQKQKPDHIPIWLMRQAGRYMAEYQLQRQGLSFLQFCKKPDVCAEAALTAVERLGVDAAILFSDILVVCEPLGLKLDFKEQQGPWIENPIRSPEAIAKLRTPNVKSDLGYVFEAIALTRKNLSPHIPLIGFCGAPFTLAAYMIEGKGSRDYKLTKQFMLNQPQAWHELLGKISELLIEYLKLQIASGCQILQMFDSWAGCLNVHHYQTYVLPHVQKIFAALPQTVPNIIFAAHAGHLLNSFAKSGAKIISLDDRVDITQLPTSISTLGIQGNLDPILLFSKPKVFLPQVKFILDHLAKHPGYIFNLGHGILPETPVDHVMALVDFVHAYRL